MGWIRRDVSSIQPDTMRESCVTYIGEEGRINTLNYWLNHLFHLHTLRTLSDNEGGDGIITFRLNSAKALLLLGKVICGPSR